MEVGDFVKAKDTPCLVGIIIDKKDIYSSWGIRHVFVCWENGSEEYCPVTRLEAYHGNRRFSKSKKEQSSHRNDY